MIPHEQISRADKSEEIQAKLALRCTKNSAELGIVWARDCDHFKGEARERLQGVFTKMLLKHGAFQG